MPPVRELWKYPVMEAVSVIIPVYNGAETLSDVVSSADEVLGAAGLRREFVLVDDASTDSSWQVIRELCQKRPNVRALGLRRNFGQHNALLAGIRAAKHDVTVTLDDDGQHPVDEIPRLLNALRGGEDVVYGYAVRSGHGTRRRLATWLTKLALRAVMGTAVATKVSAFRAFRTELRQGFADFHGPYVSIDVLLSWTTRKFAAIPTRHRPRAGGESGYSLRKLIGYSLTLVTGFTTWPLRVASLFGLILTLFGAGVLVYVLATYFGGGSVRGFTFLASVITIFAGAQLLTLGTMGEYLARMHVRLMDRPAYAIRTTIGEEVGGQTSSGVGGRVDDRS
jgi:glycosyltransferase involved in cell wall biosynthesis